MFGCDQYSANAEISYACVVVHDALSHLARVCHLSVSSESIKSTEISFCFYSLSINCFCIFFWNLIRWCVLLLLSYRLCIFFNLVSDCLEDSHADYSLNCNVFFRFALICGLNDLQSDFLKFVAYGIWKDILTCICYSFAVFTSKNLGKIMISACTFMVREMRPNDFDDYHRLSSCFYVN